MFHAVVSGSTLKSLNRKTEKIIFFPVNTLEMTEIGKHKRWSNSFLAKVVFGLSRLRGSATNSDRPCRAGDRVITERTNHACN